MPWVLSEWLEGGGSGAEARGVKAGDFGPSDVCAGGAGGGTSGSMTTYELFVQTMLRDFDARGTTVCVCVCVCVCVHVYDRIAIITQTRSGARSLYLHV